MEPFEEYGDGVLTDAAEAAPEPPDAFIARVAASENLAADMSEEGLGAIARQCIDHWKLDKDSMSEWLEQSEKGMNLAKMVKEKKTYPFENAANIVYPLITSAALQFNARSYPAIVQPDRVVKAKTWGSDPQGTKAARADRVSEHMSWQLGCRIEEWEPETDKLLVQLPIVGKMFRKWWKDTVDRRPRCRLIEPGKLIVNSKVKDLVSAPRLTEELPLYPDEIESRIRSGAFIEFSYDRDPEDESAAQEFIEQHTRLDLDEDGYPEPYVVTVHVESQTVVRIVADFAPEDVRFRTEVQQIPQPQVVQDQFTGAPVQIMGFVATEVPVGIIKIQRGTYFVDFEFMPSMDGGFHGMGLGLLLGDITESINTIINMMLDAGHYASLGGGFIGSELRLKGGAQRMRPGEWRMIQNSGNDARSAIVPVTFPGPDATLFQMLGLLIEAGREIASVKDVVTGDAQRQQTATTTLALIEQGMMLFTAAYKRIFRSLKREYKLLARMNAELVTPEEYNAFHDQVGPDGQPVMLDPAQDYGAMDMDVEPVADPRNVTKMQEASKAQLIMQLAEMGMFDRTAAARRVSEAMSIEDVEQLLPQPDPMQMQMMQMQAARAEAELMQARADIELTLAKIEGERAAAVKDMADAEAAQIGVRLDAMKMRLEDERARLDRILRGAERMAGPSGNAGNAGSGFAGNPGAQGVGVGTVLAGPPGFGGGSAGAGQIGGMGGGLL